MGDRSIGKSLLLAAALASIAVIPVAASARSGSPAPVVIAGAKKGPVDVPGSRFRVFRIR